MKELEEVEIECGPIRVDDCIGKKMTFLHDPDGCRRDCIGEGIDVMMYLEIPTVFPACFSFLNYKVDLLPSVY